MNNAAIDCEILDQLNALVDDSNPNFLSDLITVFIENTQSELELLTIAVNDSDHESVARITHSLKSTSGQLGATAFSQMFISLEAEARQSNNRSFSTLLHEILTEFERVKVALNSRNKDGSGPASSTST